MAQLTNIDRWAYINKGTKDAPVWARIGEGVTGLTPSNNPITDQKHYINHKNPNTQILGFAKQWSMALERYVGDDANDYIAGLAEKTGADIVSELVIVEYHDSAAATAKPAKKYEVTVVINSEGAIQGGAAMDMDVEMYANGDGVTGTFNTTTKTFS